MGTTARSLFGAEAKTFLKEHGVLHENGHVRLKSGRHATTYVDHRPLLLDGNRFEQAKTYLGILARACQFVSCQVVVGPERGGRVMAELLADHLSTLSQHDVQSHFLEKEGKTGLRAGPDLARFVRGKRTLVVDDVLTRGGTLVDCITLVRAKGGNVIAAAVSWNRGGVEAETLGIPTLLALIEETIPDYEGGFDCPGCRKGLPIDRTLGHPPEP